MSKIKLQLPDIKKDTKTNSIIPILNENIRAILAEIINFQSENITNENEKVIKEALDKADMIIVECHTTETFIARINSDFNRLMYEYQRLRLKYESYQLSRQVELVKTEHEEIKKQQNKIKEENNNLVYNILGFIASFSVVSASVSAIEKMNSLSNIMLFMAFTAFILLTTLIGLNNFYRNNEKNNILQDNYFLWKMMIGMIIILFIYCGIEYTKDNLEYILNCVGEGIGRTVTIEQEYSQNNE